MQIKLAIVVSLRTADMVLDRHHIQLELDDADLERTFSWNAGPVRMRSLTDGQPLSVTALTTVRLMELEGDPISIEVVPQEDVSIVDG